MQFLKFPKTIASGSSLEWPDAIVLTDAFLRRSDAVRPLFLFDVCARFDEIDDEQQVGDEGSWTEFCGLQAH